MTRIRVGVALLLPDPVAAEVDGLRRAVGERVELIAGHLTLVPPLNFHDRELPDALAVLRRAAAATKPFTITLGPPSTFLPVNPVLYLAVGGEIDAVRDLRERVMQAPLYRKPQWTFEPHVTLAEHLSPERIAAALVALADFRAEVRVERVHLLEQRHWDGGPPAWRPVADANFEEPAVVGRGGIELELSVSSQLDPVVAQLVPEGVSAPADGHQEPLAVTARRDGEVVGVAHGWVGGSSGRLVGLATADGHQGMGVASHVLAAFQSAAAARGVGVLVAKVAPESEGAGFLVHRGWVPGGHEGIVVRDLRG